MRPDSLVNFAIKDALRVGKNQPAFIVLCKV